MSSSHSSTSSSSSTTTVPAPSTSSPTASSTTKQQKSTLLLNPAFQYFQSKEQLSRSISQSQQQHHLSNSNTLLHHQHYSIDEDHFDLPAQIQQNAYTIPRKQEKNVNAIKENNFRQGFSSHNNHNNNNNNNNNNSYNFSHKDINNNKISTEETINNINNDDPQLKNIIKNNGNVNSNNIANTAQSNNGNNNTIKSMQQHNNKLNESKNTLNNNFNKNNHDIIFINREPLANNSNNNSIQQLSNSSDNNDGSGKKITKTSQQHDNNLHNSQNSIRKLSTNADKDNKVNIIHDSAVGHTKNNPKLKKLNNNRQNNAHNCDSNNQKPWPFRSLRCEKVPPEIEQQIGDSFIVDNNNTANNISTGIESNDNDIVANSNAVECSSCKFNKQKIEDVEQENKDLKTKIDLLTTDINKECNKNKMLMKQIQELLGENQTLKSNVDQLAKQQNQPLKSAVERQKADNMDLYHHPKQQNQHNVKQNYATLDKSVDTNKCCNINNNHHQNNNNNIVSYNGNDSDDYDNVPISNGSSRFYPAIPATASPITHSTILSKAYPHLMPSNREWKSTEEFALPQSLNSKPRQKVCDEMAGTEHRGVKSALTLDDSLCVIYPNRTFKQQMESLMANNRSMESLRSEPCLKSHKQRRRRESTLNDVQLICRGDNGVGGGKYSNGDFVGEDGDDLRNERVNSKSLGTGSSKENNLNNTINNGLKNSNCNLLRNKDNQQQHQVQQQRSPSQQNLLNNSDDSFYENYPLKENTKPSLKSTTPTKHSDANINKSLTFLNDSTIIKRNNVTSSGICQKILHDNSNNVNNINDINSNSNNNNTITTINTNNNLANINDNSNSMIEQFKKEIDHLKELVNCYKNQLECDQNTFMREKLMVIEYQKKMQVEYRRLQEKCEMLEDVMRTNCKKRTTSTSSTSSSTIKT